MLNTSLRALPIATRTAAPAGPVSHRVPLAHGLVGTVLLLMGGLLLVRASDALARGEWGAPAVLGAVHALTLGWLLTLIVGTLYQLGPVALQVPPRVPELWRYLLPTHVVGVLVVVWGVSVGEMRIAGFGWALLAVSTIASAIILLGPFRAPASTRARMRLVTLGFASLGVTLLLAAVRLIWGHMGMLPDLAGLRLAHIAFGLIGFGTLIAWALGSHVLPMFLGTRAQPSVSARWIPWLLLGGCVLLLPTLRAGMELLRPIAVIVAALGQGLIAWHGLVWFRGRAAVALDPALAAVALAFAALTLATLLQFVLALGVLTGALSMPRDVWPRLVAVWGVLVLAGWLAMLVAGVLLRVFVFLSWMVRAGPGVRPTASPAVRVSQFSRPLLAWSSIALFAIALTLLAISVAVGSEAGSTFAAMLYSGAAATMLAHHALALFAPPRDAARPPLPNALTTSPP